MLARIHVSRIKCFVLFDNGVVYGDIESKQLRLMVNRYSITQFKQVFCYKVTACLLAIYGMLSLKYLDVCT